MRLYQRVFIYRGIAQDRVYGPRTVQDDKGLVGLALAAVEPTTPAWNPVSAVSHISPMWDPQLIIQTKPTPPKAGRSVLHNVVMTHNYASLPVANDGKCLWLIRCVKNVLFTMVDLFLCTVRIKRLIRFWSILIAIKRPTAFW